MSELRNLALALADVLGVDTEPYLHSEAPGEHVARGVLCDVSRLFQPVRIPGRGPVWPYVEARAAIRAVRAGVDVVGALTALRVLPDGAPRVFDTGPPTGPVAGGVYPLAMEVASKLGVADLPYLLTVDGDPLALAVGLLRESLALVPAGTVAPQVRAAIAAAMRRVSLSAILAASEVAR